MRVYASIVPQDRGQCGWMACDRGICLYSDQRRRPLLRCIKHGALLTYVSALAGLAERAARKRWREIRDGARP
jgi:hypothetical protein